MTIFLPVKFNVFVVEKDVGKDLNMASICITGVQIK